MIPPVEFHIREKVFVKYYGEDGEVEGERAATVVGRKLFHPVGPGGWRVMGWQYRVRWRQGAVDGRRYKFVSAREMRRCGVLDDWDAGGRAVAQSVIVL